MSGESLEAGVVLDLGGQPLYWHLPLGRDAAFLPDSRSLWSVFFENASSISGFAHSHPGGGIPQPSLEDVTTFSAIERGLGRRLEWWIVSTTHVTLLLWTGPGKLDYTSIVLVPPDKLEDPGEGYDCVLVRPLPTWVITLRLHSYT